MTSLQAINALLQEGDRAVEQGRHADALRCFRQVLPYAVRNPVVLVRIAQAHFDLEQYAQAAEYFRTAAQARPQEARYWHNLGVTLNHAGQPQDAEQAWRQAVAVAPDYVQPWVELGKKREKEASLWEAERCYRQALDIQPGLRDCLLGLSRVKMNQGYPQEALRWHGRVVATAREDRGEIYSGYLVAAHYHAGIGARGLAILGRAAYRHYPQPVIPKAYLSKNRLTIGYLSPRLGDTPPGHMLLTILPHHDRGRVQTFCYSTHRYVDEVARQLRAAAGYWCDAQNLDDVSLARRIRADGIDVLIDLAGHSPGGRVRMLSLRPAPVQLSWLDYFDTMGLPWYDGIVSDAVSTPREAEPCFAEKVLRLPACRFVFAPPVSRPDPGPLPALRNGYVTFGSFNRMAKINDRVAQVWARILAAVPDAVLVLKNTSLDYSAEHDRHRERLAVSGISPQRLVLRPTSDPAGLWGDYQEIDIALDPFPFNGGITTFDALSMGVPVLALMGDGMVSRQSASILAACGLGAWMAADPDDYVGRAVDWSRRLEEVAVLRRSLPQVVAASPLCDAAGFARAIEEICDTVVRQQ